MAIETIALLKLPKSVFTALPEARTADDPSRMTAKAESGVTFALRLLDDGALVHTGVDFGSDDEAVIDALFDRLGDAFADHDDDRGLFVVPSVARVGAGSYEAVLAEVGEAGEWVILDEEEEGDDEAAAGELVDDGDDAGAMPGMPGMPADGDFMAMMANITNSLGADTLMSLQQAMMSGDARAFERAQNAVAAKLSQRADLVDQLQGLMGSIPPELRDMAMNSSPEQIMNQMRGQVPPDAMDAMRRLSDEKGRKR